MCVVCSQLPFIGLLCLSDYVLLSIYIPHVSINPFSRSADLLAPAIRHKLALSQRQYKLWAGERRGGEGRGAGLVGHTFIKRDFGHSKSYSYM